MTTAIHLLKRPKDWFFHIPRGRRRRGRRHLLAEIHRAIQRAQQRPSDPVSAQWALTEIEAIVKRELRK